MFRTAASTPSRRTPAARPPRRVQAALVAAAALLLLGACGSSDDLGGTVVKQGPGCALREVDRNPEAPKVAETTKVGQEVGTEDLTEGEGCPIETTTYVTLDMVGATAADGTIFRNTFADGEQPLTLRLGQGQFLPALETGLSGMQVGGRREVTVPAAQAYGADGDATLKIGPDADLVFIVDLVAVSDRPQYCNPLQAIAAGPEGSTKPTTVALPAEPVEELKTTDLKEGTGEAIEAGNYVEVHYLGVSCASGREFDTSWKVRPEPDPDAGSVKPFPVTVGEGTIPGFAEGLIGMKVGGVRQVDIPADQAYGGMGSEPNIGPNDPLTFILEVVSVSATPPTTTTVPAGEPGADGETPTTAPGAEGDTATTVAGSEPDAQETTVPEAD